MPGAITGLVGAGGGGVIGGAVVRLVLDSSQFNSGLAQAQGRLQSIGSSMSRVGSSLTRGVTVPLVAAGAVATKMALDFNAAFVKIQTLSGKTGQSIEQMKESVLQLAGETGQAPTELANGLYFLASAGLKASDVMPALEASAKAAAIGLGSVSDVANVVSSALFAYSKSGLTATDVTNTLAAAVKAGRAEPEEFATALGRILPIASQAGVSFAEVAASLAAVSDAGLDVNEGVTAMRGVLQALVAPGTAAADAMKKVGISTDEMRAAIADKGLLGALQLLDKATGGNIDQMRTIIPNIRALTGAFALTGQSAKKVGEIFDFVTGKVKTADKAFQIWGQSITGKNAKALGKLQAAAVKLGEQLIPIFEKIVDAVSAVVDAFSKLPEGIQSVIVKGLVLAALVGPVLKLASAFITLGRAIGGIPKVPPLVPPGLPAQLPLFTEAAAAASGVGTSIGVMTVAGAAAIPVLGALATDTITSATGMQTMKEKVLQARAAFRNGEISVGEFAGAIKGAGAEGIAFNRSLGPVSAGLHSVAQHSKQADTAALALNHSFKSDAQAAKQADTAALALNHSLDGTARSAHGAASGAKGAAGGFKSAGSAAGDAQGKTEDLGRSLEDVGRQHPRPTITVDNHQALGAVGAVLGALGRVDGYNASATITTTYRTVGAPPGGAGVSYRAEGGIIRGASGFVTRGPTYMVGEGGYSTFAGRGAEAVIPLNSRGIAILSKALRKAGGHGGVNVTINTQGAMDPNQLAASVSRHLARTIREEALV